MQKVGCVFNQETASSRVVTTVPSYGGKNKKQRRTDRQTDRQTGR